jgi:hypothetical protein
LAYRREALPPAAWQIAEAESVLGAALAAMGRHREAEPLLRSGFSRLEARLGLRTQAAQDPLARFRG